jgi:tRNA-dihydrouridine synthase A
MTAAAHQPISRADDAPSAGRRARRASPVPVSIAPMMDYSTRHFRRFMRALTRRSLVYTEMVTTGALLHGDAERHLAFDPVGEGPVALQLGGDDPQALAACARLGHERGYDEINLNVGCPSDRVQRGRFGACLMADPERVRDCVAAMREAVPIAVTVKHRIGIDELDSYEHMLRFVDVVAAAGADRFTVHARKAWLQGLSPKQNRTVPPLRHAEIHRLKRERPALLIETNGGVRSLDEVQHHLEHVDGVMIGRAAYEDPWVLHDVDARFVGAANPSASRHEAVRSYLPYIEARRSAGERLGPLVKPIIGMFAGQHGGRRFRRHLAERAHQPGAGPETVQEALALVPESSPSPRPRVATALALVVALAGLWSAPSPASAADADTRGSAVPAWVSDAVACTCAEAGTLSIDTSRSVAADDCTCPFAAKLRGDLADALASVPATMLQAAPDQLARQRVALALEREFITRSPDHERLFRYDMDRFRWFLEHVRCDCPQCDDTTVFFSKCNLGCTPSILYKKRARIWLALGLSTDALIDYYLAEHNATHDRQVERDWLLPGTHKDRGWGVPALLIGGAIFGLFFVVRGWSGRRRGDRRDGGGVVDERAEASADADTDAHAKASATRRRAGPLGAADRARLDAALDDLDE